MPRAKEGQTIIGGGINPQLLESVRRSTGFAQNRLMDAMRQQTDLARGSQAARAQTTSAGIAASAQMKVAEMRAAAELEGAREDREFQERMINEKATRNQAWDEKLLEWEKEKYGKRAGWADRLLDDMRRTQTIGGITDAINAARRDKFLTGVFGSLQANQAKQKKAELEMADAADKRERDKLIMTQSTQEALDAYGISPELEQLPENAWWDPETSDLEEKMVSTAFNRQQRMSQIPAMTWERLGDPREMEKAISEGEIELGDAMKVEANLEALETHLLGKMDEYAGKDLKTPKKQALEEFDKSGKAHWMWKLLDTGPWVPLGPGILAKIRQAMPDEIRTPAGREYEYLKAQLAEVRLKRNQWRGLRSSTRPMKGEEENKKLGLTVGKTMENWQAIISGEGLGSRVSELRASGMGMDGMLDALTKGFQQMDLTDTLKALQQAGIYDALEDDEREELEKQLRLSEFELE